MNQIYSKGIKRLARTITDAIQKRYNKNYAGNDFYTTFYTFIYQPSYYQLQTSVITIIYGRKVIRTIGIRYEVVYSGASARVTTEFVEYICGRCQGNVSSNCERRVRKR